MVRPPPRWGLVPSAIVAVLSAPLAGCLGSNATVTLETALREVAPDYRARAPANGTSDLGRRLIDDQPETNACFDGDKSAVSPGWSKLQMTYEDSVDTKLKADFGAIVSVPASPELGVSTKGTASITLTDIVLEQLGGVYFNAAGSCVGLYDTPGQNFARVLSRALKAGTIAIEGDQAIATRLRVDVAKIGGVEVGVGDKSLRKLQGTSLYFGDFSECFSITTAKKECTNLAVGPGNVCDLNQCSFQVTALDTATGAWKGKLSCQAGAPTDWQGTMGEWGEGKKVAPGVSYNLRVLPGAGTGTVHVALLSWSTRSEPLAKCPK